MPLATDPPHADGACACAATPCSGNATEFCGGSYQISVYNYSCSGAHVPKPSPAPPAPPKPKPPPPPPAPYVPPKPCEFNDPKCSELYNPCLNTSLPYHAMPFCNATLSLQERAKDMISRTNLSEKIAMLGNRGSAVAGMVRESRPFWGHFGVAFSRLRSHLR